MTKDEGNEAASIESAQNTFQNEQFKVFDPVKWSGAVTKLSDDEYELVMKATIEDKWHLYTQRSYGDFGPSPTKFTFADAGKGFETIGKVEESPVKEVYDKVFDKNISYYEGEGTFRQKIKVTNKDLKTIIAEVDFMVCDDQRCLPPTLKEIKFDLATATVAKLSKKEKL